MWHAEWPKQKGLYWFYGWRWKPYKGKEEPELCLVKVSGTAEKGKFAYVTHGHFLYAGEGATGMWQQAELPELPKLGPYEDFG